METAPELQNALNRSNAPGDGVLSPLAEPSAGGSGCGKRGRARGCAEIRQASREVIIGAYLNILRLLLPQSLGGGFCKDE